MKTPETNHTPLNPHADEERPVTLNFTNAPDGVLITIAFGYQHGEAIAALFHGETLVLIPRSVLEVALTQGWSDTTVCECCVAEDAVVSAAERGEA